MKVALTQSAGRLERLAPALEARGVTVLRTPLIETRLRGNATTLQLARELIRCPWLLFTSRSAVAAWQELGLTLSAARLGAVGPATAAALRAAGGQVDLIAEPATAAGLARAFLEHTRAAAGPVALPHGNLASSTLADLLSAAGVTVRPLVIYETVTRPWRGDETVDAVVLASPSAVRALPEEVAARSTLVTLGPSTSRAVRSRGFIPRQADAPTADALLHALGGTA